MSEFRQRVEGGGGLSVLRELREGERRFLCYTSFAESLWRISVSDGVRVWSLSLSETEVEGLAVKSQQPQAAFISSVSSSLSAGEGEVEVECAASSLTLCLKIAPESVQLSLPEATDPTNQLSSLIFLLWSQLDSTRSQLADCLKQLEGAQPQKATQQDVLLPDVSRKSGSSRAKRPVGASLVNPSLKRRKAVKGVIFGNSQDEK